MAEDSNSHTLDPDQSETGTLTTTRDEEGNYDAIVSSPDDEDMVSVKFSSSLSGELYGYVRAQYGGSPVSIPVYNPDTIDYPCWRVQIDEGVTGAFHIEDRGNADFRALSIETAGGPKAISQTEQTRGQDVSVNALGPSTISTTDEINVDVTIDNSGAAEVSGTATLEMNSVELDTYDYTTPADSSSEFTLTAGPFQSGEYQWIVNTPHGSDTGTVNVTEPKAVIDDFEHNNLSNYYTDGDLSHYSVSSEWAYEGNYSLRNSTDYYGTMISSYSGLDNYPQEGDRINMMMRTNFTDATSTSTRPSIRFGHQDHSEFYEARFRIDTPRLILAESHNSISGWNTFAMQDINLSLPSNTDLMFSVWWQSDEIGMRIFNDETGNAITPYVSGTPEYHSATSGGFGVSLESQSSSNVMWVDDVHLE